jgi:hypothetical protein
MWQITSALIEDRLSELRADAAHQRLVAVARRARKGRRAAKSSNRDLAPTPAAERIEEPSVRIPRQRSAEFDHANK